MTSSSHTHGAPSTSTTHPVTHVVTPPVTQSSTIKKIVIIVVSIIVLVAIVILWSKINSTSNGNGNDQSTSSGKNSSGDNFKGTMHNMRYTTYGNTLDLVIEPGQAVKVRLTNDYLPLWSSNAIDTRDSKGIERVLEGAYFIQGPPVSSDVTYRIFENNSQFPITVKIGRCNSKNDCGIQFETQTI
jgi:hypothetical protein